MPLGCVSLTDAAGIATTASGFRQSALDHDLGGAKQLAKPSAIHFCAAK